MRAVGGRAPSPPRSPHASAQTVSDAALRGGQVYDALVAITAADRGARLVTRDRRAERTCRAVGVDCLLIG